MTTEAKREEIRPCIRCGQCCLHIPCEWAQIRYGLNKKRRNCPSLKKEGDGMYTCLSMNRSNPCHKMLGTGCEATNWRQEREVIVLGQCWNTGDGYK